MTVLRHRLSWCAYNLSICKLVNFRGREAVILFFQHEIKSEKIFFFVFSKQAKSTIFNFQIPSSSLVQLEDLAPIRWERGNWVLQWQKFHKYKAISKDFSSF